MRKIKLTQGYSAICDNEDYPILSKRKWWVHKGADGILYAISHKKLDKWIYSSELMHRLVMGVEKGKQIDHINRNSLDNRKSNLRICSQRLNVMNTKKKSKTKKYKGVYFKPKHKFNKWAARIIVHKGKPGYKDIWIGAYKTEEEAAIAYNNKAKELFGEYAYLNKVGVPST